MRIVVVGLLFLLIGIALPTTSAQDILPGYPGFWWGIEKRGHCEVESVGTPSDIVDCEFGSYWGLKVNVPPSHINRGGAYQVVVLSLPEKKEYNVSIYVWSDKPVQINVIKLSGLFGELVLSKTISGRVRIDVKLEDENYVRGVAVRLGTVKEAPDSWEQRIYEIVVDDSCLATQQTPWLYVVAALVVVAGGLLLIQLKT